MKLARLAVLKIDTSEKKKKKRKKAAMNTWHSNILLLGELLQGAKRKLKGCPKRSEPEDPQLGLCSITFATPRAGQLLQEPLAASCARAQQGWWRDVSPDRTQKARGWQGSSTEPRPGAGAGSGTSPLILGRSPRGLAAGAEGHAVTSLVSQGNPRGAPPARMGPTLGAQLPLLHPPGWRDEP